MLLVAKFPPKRKLMLFAVILDVMSVDHMDMLEVDIVVAVRLDVVMMDAVRFDAVTLLPISCPDATLTVVAVMRGDATDVDAVIVEAEREMDVIALVAAIVVA